MSTRKLHRYRVWIAQTVFHGIDIEAPDEDTAGELATDRYLTEDGILAYQPPAPWDCDTRDCEIEAVDLLDQIDSTTQGGAA